MKLRYSTRTVEILLDYIEHGTFYFLQEDYAEKFSREYDMIQTYKRKDGASGKTGRPFLVMEPPFEFKVPEHLKDYFDAKKIDFVYFIIPITSRTEKYRAEIIKQEMRNSKIKRIVEVSFYGQPRHVLIQNTLLCNNYHIKEPYIFRSNTVRLSDTELRTVKDALIGCLRYCVMHPEEAHKIFYTNLSGLFHDLLWDKIKWDKQQAEAAQEQQSYYGGMEL